jgi:FkbM family methyltransferase
MSDKISSKENRLETQKTLSNFQDLFGKKSTRVKSVDISERDFTLIYEVEHGKNIKMTIDPRDLRTAPMSILSDGNYEELELQILLMIAKISNLFCDVGANIGFYTLASSRVNLNLKILCFEPNKLVVKSLENNLMNNSSKISTSNITIFPTALGEFEVKNAELFVPIGSGSGAGSLKNLHPDEGATEILNIEIVSLDSILVNEPLFDLMKIDVEGFELSVLKGALQTIERFKPTIFIELLRKWMKPFGDAPQDVVELLATFGYICFAIGVESLNEIEIIDDQTIENNFIFVHSQRIEHFNLIFGRS